MKTKPVQSELCLTTSILTFKPEVLADASNRKCLQRHQTGSACRGIKPEVLAEASVVGSDKYAANNSAYGLYYHPHDF